LSNIPIEFSVTVEGETTGETFKGVFKARPRLSHSLTLLRDQFRRDLIGTKSEGASQEAINVATVFSKIWAHVVDAPSWWKESGKGLELLDESVIAAIYENVLRIEREASVSIKKAGEEAAKVLKEDSKP
jgi:hypothetical protein